MLSKLQTAVQMKTACAHAIYRKSLFLANSARKEFTVGQIVNLITTDAQTLEEVIPKLNMVWSMPLQVKMTLLGKLKGLKFFFSFSDHPGANIPVQGAGPGCVWRSCNTGKLIYRLLL